jgi:hypothetical protein
MQAYEYLSVTRMSYAVVHFHSECLSELHSARNPTHHSISIDLQIKVVDKCAERAHIV